MRATLLSQFPDHPWLRRFREDSSSAIAELLGGSADLGTLEGAEPSVLLTQWLELIDDQGSFRTRVDKAFADWIDASWGQSRLDSAGRHVGLTINAWLAIAAVIRQNGSLPESARRLREHLLSDPDFLDSLRIGASKDPLAAAYLAIARYQTDDVLVPLWLRIAGLEGQPFERGSVGVQALTYIPLADPNRLPIVALRALRLLGASLYERSNSGLLDEPRARAEFGRVAGLLFLRFPAVAHKAQWVVWWDESFAEATPFPHHWLPEIAVDAYSSSPRVAVDEAPSGPIAHSLTEGGAGAAADADRLFEDLEQDAQRSDDAGSLVKPFSKPTASAPQGPGGGFRANYRANGSLMPIAVLSKEGLFGDALASLLTSQGRLMVVAFEHSPREMINAAKEHGAQVLVVDSTDLKRDEVEFLFGARAFGDFGIVLIVGEGERQAFDEFPVDRIVSRRSGASALFEALEDLGSNVRTTGRPLVRETRRNDGNGAELTHREQMVAQLVAKGMSNRKISQVTGLPEQSIKNLVSAVMRKLHCENRVLVALKLRKAAR